MTGGGQDKSTNRASAKHAASLALLLFALWLGLSGHVEPLLLGLGVVSTALAVFLAIRMELLDRESYPVHLKPSLLRHLLFLMREIFLANIDVAKRILTPGPAISPQLIRVPMKQRSTLGKVIYANSITLTPGTVSLRLEDDTILVHALTREGAADLASGRMARVIPDDVGETGR
jgi:multicomponent Na+:H+ antiporter subunit E